MVQATRKYESGPCGSKGRLEKQSTIRKRNNMKKSMPREDEQLKVDNLTQEAFERKREKK